MHSYFANTWLVYNKNDENDIRYYVAEGGCSYLSTIDVAHETAIFEAEYIPWALKKQLSEWKNYITLDKSNNGLFVQHDMGMYPSKPPHQPNQPAILKNQAYIMFFNTFGAMPLE